MQAERPVAGGVSYRVIIAALAERTESPNQTYVFQAGEELRHRLGDSVSPLDFDASDAEDLSEGAGRGRGKRTRRIGARGGHGSSTLARECVLCVCFTLISSVFIVGKFVMQYRKRVAGGVTHYYKMINDSRG